MVVLVRWNFSVVEFFFRGALFIQLANLQVKLSEWFYPKYGINRRSISLNFPDKSIDWKNVDLKKLRVKELKKILEDWGEVCWNIFFLRLG